MESKFKNIIAQNLTIADEAIEDFFNNQVAKPKFADKAKVNEKNIQNIKNRQGLLMVLARNKMITGIPII